MYGGRTTFSFRYEKINGMTTFTTSVDIDVSSFSEDIEGTLEQAKQEALRSLNAKDNAESLRIHEIVFHANR